jgi:hypothetical protein
MGEASGAIYGVLIVLAFDRVLPDAGALFIEEFDPIGFQQAGSSADR